MNISDNMEQAAAAAADKYDASNMHCHSRTYET